MLRAFVFVAATLMPRHGSPQAQTDVLSLRDTLSPLLLPAEKRKRAMTSLVLPLSMNGT